jgi:predicted DsbA family dithiol-disulfide isomerase
LQCNIRGSVAVPLLVVTVPARAQTAPKVEPLAEVEGGTRADVTGAPAFVIHGRLLSGAQPLQRSVRSIADALARGR